MAVASRETTEMDNIRQGWGGASCEMRLTKRQAQDDKFGHCECRLEADAVDYQIKMWSIEREKRARSESRQPRYYYEEGGLEHTTRGEKCTGEGETIGRAAGHVTRRVPPAMH